MISGGTSEIVTGSIRVAYRTQGGVHPHPSRNAESNNMAERGMPFKDLFQQWQAQMDVIAERRFS